VLYADCTEAAFKNVPAFAAQFAQPLDHHLATMDRSLRIDLYGHTGIAVGDVDGDLVDDVYLADTGGLPNRMLVHRPDGTVTDVSAAMGVDFLDVAPSALLVDLDNDGDEDLVIGHPVHTRLLENDGHGHFTFKAALPACSTSMSAADYDNDGLIDLYFCNYDSRDEAGGEPVPYWDANNGRANYLLRNRGKLDFEDVTAASGMDVNNRRFSMACAWEDYDNDGDQDLFVANDFGRDNLYRNDGGHFSDISAGMGATWGDADRDGRMDLYVSNMFSSAGNRIAYQARFRPDLSGAVRAAIKRHARGNTLYTARKDGKFDDASERAAVTMGRWAWGAQFVDLNSDGYEDIVVPNGFITNDDKQDL